MRTDIIAGRSSGMIDHRIGRLRAVRAHLCNPAPTGATAAVAFDAEPSIPRLSAAATPGEIAETLGEHGVVVVENLVDPSHMRRVEDELADKGVFYGEPGSFARSDTTRNAGKALRWLTWTWAPATCIPTWGSLPVNPPLPTFWIVRRPASPTSA